MEQIVLLNSNYSFLGVINWKKAIKLMVKGKAEVIKNSNNKLNDEYIIPQVLRLVNLVKIVYKNKIPYSKKNVFIRDRFKCKYCGKKTLKPTVDHVFPQSRGGKSTFENCVCSCKVCNCKKNDMTPKEAKMPILGQQPHHPSVMEFLRHKMSTLNVDLSDIFQ